MTSAQHSRLVELIKELAVVHGRVTLSSGIEADYYVDLRRATLHHEAAPLIGQVMLDMLDEAGITDFEAAGGLTMGADPVGTAIMHQAAARGRKVDAFVVRKAAKAHGMGRQVEGPDVKGRVRSSWLKTLRLPAAHPSRLLRHSKRPARLSLPLPRWSIATPAHRRLSKTPAIATSRQ
ncbi:MAG: hypothetical protein RIR29_204 [Actinomycetota bacterium]